MSGQSSNHKASTSTAVRPIRFIDLVKYITARVQWRKKMFLDRGADLPKEPRRYCGILFLILRVWFFSGDGGGGGGGAGAPPSPPASYASGVD